uniref:CASP-like protein 5A1 n=1 Tax=Erigeron canadensis TaxID=72917 RepID=UPI001CB906CA|nr:CASP-like protein 5A1 [Erigeron canadensis]
MSRPAVHPVEPPPMIDGRNDAPPPRRVRMKDVQGMPGTPAGLILRVLQFIFAVISLSVMSSTSDFPSVTSFRYLVGAVGLQCLWSLSAAIIDVYALCVKRSLRNHAVITVYTIGDGVTSTLTFAAACACAGITVLISNDLNTCDVNHCKRFMSATAMAFLSWFAVSPSFFLNFWSLASQ